MIVQDRKEAAEVAAGDIVKLPRSGGVRQVIVAEVVRDTLAYKGEPHQVVRLTGVETVPGLRPVRWVAVPDQRVTVARVV